MKFSDFLRSGKSRESACKVRKINISWKSLEFAFQSWEKLRITLKSQEFFNEYGENTHIEYNLKHLIVLWPMRVVINSAVLLVLKTPQVYLHSTNSVDLQCKGELYIP